MKENVNKPRTGGIPRFNLFDEEDANMSMGAPAGASNTPFAD